MANVTDAWVRSRYDEGISPIRSEVRSYWLNHAFMEGDQWLFWDTSRERLDETPVDHDRVQATMNRLRANTRTIMANLTQRDLAFEVPPTAADDASIRAARLSSTILEDLRVGHDWETLREANMVSTLKGGSSAICVDWDTKSNDTVETVLSISEMVVEPGSRDAETARWWVKTQVLPPREVKAMFDMEATPAADASTGLSTYQARPVTTGDPLTPLTLVLTYYERPNPACELGRFLVEVDGQIVQKGDWSFPWKDRLNFALTRETLIETQWAGSTIYDDARPVQVALNAVWSNKLEHLRSAGNVRMLVPSSAADFVKQVTDIPGEMIEYPDGLQKPEYMQMPQMSSWVNDLAVQLADMLDDILGVHDISRGNAPANIESGYGLSILAEKDSSPVARLIKESAKAWTKVGRMCLKLYEAEKKGSNEATINQGYASERIQWTKNEIKGQTGAIIPVETIIPRNRAAQAQFADKAMQMGLITNIAQYTALADMPGQESLISAAAPDLAKARRENALFTLHEIALPAQFDNHEVHIQGHNDFRKTQQYEQLPDDEREVVDMHVQAHETMAAEEAGRQRMKEQIDPALNAAPNAAGTPAVDPLALASEAPAPEPAPMPEQAAPMTPDEITDDLMASLDTLGG